LRGTGKRVEGSGERGRVTRHQVGSRFVRTAGNFPVAGPSVNTVVGRAVGFSQDRSPLAGRSVVGRAGRIRSADPRTGGRTTAFVLGTRRGRPSRRVGARSRRGQEDSRYAEANPHRGIGTDHATAARLQSRAIGTAGRCRRTGGLPGPQVAGCAGVGV